MSIAKRKCPAFSRYLFQCNAKSAPISTSAGGSPLAAAMPQSAAPPVRSAAAATAARAALLRGRPPIARLRSPRQRRLRPTTPGADAPFRWPACRPPPPPAPRVPPPAPAPRTRVPPSVPLSSPSRIAPSTFRDRLARGSPVFSPDNAGADLVRGWRRRPAPAAGGRIPRRRAPRDRGSQRPTRVM